jgi:protein NUD1
MTRYKLTAVRKVAITCNTVRARKTTTSLSQDIMAVQPAWQTEELKDEWPEEGDGVSEHYTRSISLTIPVGSLHSPVHSGTGLSHWQDTDSDVADVVGTFLIRQDTLPALPQRLTAQKKGLIKDFFSPIALERMFDPPSPRTSVSPSSNPSARIDHHRPLQSPTIPTSSITPIGGQERHTNRRPTGTSLRPDMSCSFTFSVPHPVPLTHIASSSPTQGQNSTRTTTAVAPLTDPPLRLFQFQYDTFTRDHLSAMVDSIAVNSPSGSNTGKFLPSTSSPFGLPPVSEASAHSNSIELRSAKRVKLSPPNDLHRLKSRSSLGRPARRKDYVGESRFLMAQIKSAKHSFSTPPSAASIPYPKPNDSLPFQSGVQDLCESRPSMLFLSSLIHGQSRYRRVALIHWGDAKIRS